MQNRYSVNMKLRDELINEMRKEQKPYIAVWNKLYQAGIIVMIGILLIAIGGFIFGTAKWDMFDRLMFIAPVIIFLAVIEGIVYIIAFACKAHMEKKYLRPWIPYSEEQLWLHNKSMEWGHCNRFYNGQYWKLQMKYDDIQRIEYDEKQHLIRVYGSYKVRRWEDGDKDYYIDSYDVSWNEKDDDHFILCEYYDNFWQLVKDLEELSGKTIDKKNRPMKF